MAIDVQSYEKLGAFYLGRRRDPETGAAADEPLLYDSRDLLTHGLCVGMTGSGKTGLCLSLIEEAAIDGLPAIVVDPKGDLGNLLLTFPELRPEDFAPWVDPDEAARQGIPAGELAARTAGEWRDGLARWGQDGARIARLREAAELAIYTPGSEAGLPVSVLATFAAPSPEAAADGDLLRDRVGTIVAGLLGLLGIDADPVRSREHILLATVFDAAWRQGRDLDLAGLIQEIQKPPVDRIGVLDLESFFPAKDRFGLAMAVNNLLAAPGFAAWLQGEPLDLDRLLYTPAGKPRIAIFSIAHLGDAERMFFVSLLLSQTLGWLRSRPGTTSLRAVLYMDEIFGYFPPVAEPPSKRPLLSLLKQGRAFGLGVLLATQNPVDLDYRGLANIGTWFLGRLQTERDKQRLLDGLEGAAGTGGFDRSRMEALLSGLEKRVFLLHDVHEEGPVLFETRWALSYLRGPLTRPEIKRLMDPLRTGRGAGGAVAAPAGMTATVASAPAAGAAPAAASAAPSQAAAPVLPADVPQAFLPVRGRPEGIVYRPALLAAATVHYADAKRGLDHAEEVRLLAPLAEGGADWYAARAVELAPEDLETEPVDGAAFAPLPPEAARAKSYAAWEKDLAESLYRTAKCDLWKSPTLGETSRPGESEREFRIRLGEGARERRDEEKEKLRAKYAERAARLGERLRRAEQAHERETEQARQQKLQTGISLGVTVLGALFGRKAFSSGTLGRATTAVRGAGRAYKEGQDVDRAAENVDAVKRELADLDAQLDAEVAALAGRFDPQTETLEPVSLKPKKTDVLVRRLTLAWAPHRAAAPAWE